MAADVPYSNGMIICSDVLGLRVFRMKFYSWIVKRYVEEQVPSFERHYTSTRTGPDIPLFRRTMTWRQPGFCFAAEVQKVDALEGDIWLNCPTCTRMLVSTRLEWEAGVRRLLLSSSNL